MSVFAICTNIHAPETEAKLERCRDRFANELAWSFFVVKHARRAEGSWQLNVRFGSLADISERIRRCPLCPRKRTYSASKSTSLDAISGQRIGPHSSNETQCS